MGKMGVKWEKGKQDKGQGLINRKEKSKAK